MKKDIIFVLLISLIAVTFFRTGEESNNTQFELWKKKYGVHWEAEEEAYRHYIFEKNIEEIKKHNSDLSQTFRKGINQFTIFTE